MKKWKIYLIIILLVLFVIFDIFAHLNNRNNEIFLGNNTKISIKKGEITIKNENSKVNLTKAKIFFNNEFIDGYIKSNKTKMNNGVIVYDVYNNNGDLLRFNDDLIAYTGKSKIEIADSNVLDVITNEDDEIISRFLLSEFGNGISLDVPLSYNYYKKVIYDIDNDGDDEYLYSLDVVESGVIDYSYVFIVDEGEDILVSNEKGEIKDSDLPRVYFFNLIDFDGDSKYEIVIRNKKGEYGKNIYKIFSYNDVVSEIK